MPSWVQPGPVYVKRHNHTKYDLPVKEAESKHIPIRHNYVRLEDGREVSFSLRDFASYPKSLNEQSFVVENQNCKNNADKCVDSVIESDLTNEVPID